MKKITIIGSGFGALSAARTIRKNDRRAEITIISPRAELVYLPSLIWVASGRMSERDVVIPLDNFFKRARIQHLPGRAKDIENLGRTVVTEAGERYENDALIIASGGRFLSPPGVEHTLMPCSLAGAKAFHSRLQALEKGVIAVGFSGNPKDAKAMRGGPIFEFLFGADTRLKKESRRDRFELIFFTPTKTPGARLGERAVALLLEEMKKRHIKTHLGHKILRFENRQIITEGGNINADLIVFMPGMTADKWLENTALSRNAGGLVVADEFCQASGLERVFIAGDVGSFPGPEWAPKQAHMADLQGAAAAKNTLDVLNGKQPSHRFKTELICILDSNNKGMLVKRNNKKTVMLPNWWIFHWLKKIFARFYVRKYS